MTTTYGDLNVNKTPDWASILKQGASGDWFGHKDYFHARRQGVSNIQIRDYLDRIGHGAQGGVRGVNRGQTQGGKQWGVYNIASEAARLDELNNTAIQEKQEISQGRILDLEALLGAEQQKNENLFSDTSAVTDGGINPSNQMAIGPGKTGPMMTTDHLARKTTPGKKKTTASNKSLTSGLNIGTSTGLSY
tara:strand:+ start:954 stop:1526 length:573 start_codon:yes stop_codon:yes gene_type:complete